MDELLKRVKEAIALYLESEGEPAGYENEFVGVQVVEA
jgi:predicted RNase H-like HicB family nuclease